MTETVTLESLAETGNIAETLARELKAPQAISSPIAEITRVALPPGWNLREIDDEKHTAAPQARKGAAA